MKISIKDAEEEKVKKPAEERAVKEPVPAKAAAGKEKEASKKPALVLPDKEKSTKAKPWEAKARKTEVVEEKPKEAPKMEAIAEKKVRKEGEYGAKDIQVLKGLEPVRLRPGMYIGSTGLDGLHHLIWECLDNSIDESMAGYAKEIGITLLPNNRVSVSDDGRGIPVEKHPDTGKSTLETVLTTLHAGGKFGGDAYKVSGGLHGVGVSVVCALSTFMEAEIQRDGGVYKQEYFRGVPKGAVKKVADSKKSGTTITFEADPQIFPEIKYDPKKILNHVRQQAYLTRGVKITFRDERKKGEESDYGFYFEGGVGSFVKFLVMSNTPRHQNIFSIATTKQDVAIEAAFQYTQEMECTEQSFANNIYTPEGGTHISGFRSALTRCLNTYGRREGFLKEKDENFSGEDVREGLTAVVSVKIRNPQFEGQTKAKLGNPEAKGAVEDAVMEGLTDYLERNPTDARAIIENCLLATKARLAAKAARATVLRKGVLEGLALPGKLADCLSKDPEESELYIVEGDSAGGCFDGNTKIALADGRNISFIDLVKEHEQGKKNYCYTVKADGSIGIELILNPRLTKKNTEVIKVILDNSEELICTPDHKFMLRDGSYKMAQDLMPTDSLMPFHGFQNYIQFENKFELRDVAVNYNHKIKKIVTLSEKIDVYDIEVPGTHNFALASGVFVHNSAKMARDRRFQAILPLKGKILNVERARLDKMLSSKEIKSIIIALGTAVAEDFSLEKLRYHRIIIMTDADVDGSHIRTLLLTLFYRYFKPIMEAGYIYIAQPPLYKIQQGKTVQYAYTEEQKDTMVAALPKTTAVNLQRYKGLGEMDSEQLWDTTMNPANRLLLKVEIDDAHQTDKTFDILMGEEVEPRKKFIQTHAKSVKNLDI